MPASNCPRCGEKIVDGVTHTNPTVGFEGVCNDCQAEMHTTYRAARAARRAKAIAASNGGSW